jgi:hypothetical protein
MSSTEGLDLRRYEACCDTEDAGMSDPKRIVSPYPMIAAGVKRVCKRECECGEERKRTNKTLQSPFVQRVTGKWGR